MTDQSELFQVVFLDEAADERDEASHVQGERDEPMVLHEGLRKILKENKSKPLSKIQQHFLTRKRVIYKFYDNMEINDG